MTDWSRGRVMVTGGGGFLGKVVVGKLRDAGATDIGIMSPQAGQKESND